MKRLLLSILFLLIYCSTTHAGTVVRVLGGTGTACADPSCTGFLVCQNLETATTGWDNGPETWTTVSGTINPVYTGTVLRGTQSLQVDSITTTDGLIYTAFTAQSEVWFFMRFQTDTVGASNYIVYLRSAGIAKAAVRITAASPGYLLGTQGTINVTSTTTALSANTTYYLWGYYKAESADLALDGKLDLWVSTSATKPGTKDVEITNGDSESTVDRFYVSASATDYATLADQILVDNAIIGDVCE